jgi:hypothetical protein
LVDLLDYLEAQERYSLFAGERKKCAGYQQTESIADLRPAPVTSTRAAVQT